jgi:hypothetical protein
LAQAPKLLFTIIALFALSCITPRGPQAETPKVLSYDGVIRLVGRWSFGHACPCDNHVFTAAHLSHPHFGRPGFPVVVIGYAWSDLGGRSGYMVSASAFGSLARDVGLLKVNVGAPSYYRHAQVEPEPGDEVSWIEYRRGSKKDFYGVEEKKAKVIRNMSGHIVLDTGPTPGASGTCLFNTANEVVGIIVWRVPVNLTEVAGVAVSLAGRWWPEAK